jgi:hypothetical protein
VLADFDGIHLEATIQSGANFLGIEKCSASDLVECEKSFRLPFPEGPKARPGGFTGEYDLDAVLCADELFRSSHEREDAFPRSNMLGLNSST